jgi:hypothetical protein
MMGLIKCDRHMYLLMRIQFVLKFYFLLLLKSICLLLLLFIKKKIYLCYLNDLPRLSGGTLQSNYSFRNGYFKSNQTFMIKFDFEQDI